jgi:hypothetical protein
LRAAEPDEKHALPRVGRLEAVAVAVAAVAMLAVYIWASGYWIDLIDEGYFVYLGSRVAAGDLPYRDFDTYYTPGIFYLFAWTFDLFGMTIEPIRVLMSALRVLWALMLYALTRRVAPWPFAMLPFLVIAAVDAAPIFPEPHPSWPSVVATLGTIEVIARHQTGGRRRWLIAAGLLAGIAFAFKQNIGAFAALAIGAYVLMLRPDARAGRLVLMLQAVFAAGLGAAVILLLRPGLDGRLAGALLLPFLATLAVIVWIAWTRARPEGWTMGLSSILLDAASAGAAFAVVTAAWMVPLALALGLHETPWGLFVGNVNQGALVLPFDLPSPAARWALPLAIWAPILVALLGGRREWLSKRLLGVAVLLTVAALILPTGVPPDDGLMDDPGLYPWLSYFQVEFGTLFNYLPALGGWAGVAMLAHATLKQIPSRPLAWYLVAGSLTSLSLYPRVDAIHAMFAGPVLLVIGAWGLAIVHRTLTRGTNVAVWLGVYASLMILPIATVLPHAYWRYVTIVHADPRATTPPPYVELGLERAPVRVPEFIAASVRGAVEYVQERTPSGEPFFVYPVDPLFYFLADRPNPTRFNHFIAGALTPADLQDVIDDLDRTKPRYVLWDHGGATYFKTDLTNRVLSDYIWGCYAQVANFTPYLILERHCP